MTDLSYLSITEAGELIRQKSLSPVKLVRECLDCIGRLNPTLNAFITVLADQALKEAKRAEAEIQRNTSKGPLHGIPVGVKDFFDTAGIKTTAGSEQFRNRVPANDAGAVTMLKNAGAIILGKINMH